MNISISAVAFHLIFISERGKKRNQSIVSGNIRKENEIDSF